MKEKKLKVLFVCKINKMRSATAHKIFESDDRFEVKSAGTDKSAKGEILCLSFALFAFKKASD